MKRLAVTLTANLWVPDDYYETPGSLNMLAVHLNQQVSKPLKDWASAPEFAVTDPIVSVEVQE